MRLLSAYNSTARLSIINLRGRAEDFAVKFKVDREISTEKGKTNRGTISTLKCLRFKPRLLKPGK